MRSGGFAFSQRALRFDENVFDFAAFTGAGILPAFNILNTYDQVLFKTPARAIEFEKNIDINIFHWIFKGFNKIVIMINIKNIKIANDLPFVLIAGPDSIESEDHALFMAREIKKITTELNIPYIFKASYDKANRTSVKSFRGVGLKKGLDVLKKIQSKLNLPVTTDVHSPKEALQAGEIVDLIQIPAFLSRQTDLLIAAGKTGKPINIKKGQFIAPQNVDKVIQKIQSTGNNKVIITERGVTFGYNDVVTDMRGLEIMKKFGSPVILDAAHTVQFPSVLNENSGGDRTLIPALARAAIGVGVAGIFIEVHDDLDNAPVDGLNSLDLKDLKNLLMTLKKIDTCVK